MTAQPLAIVTGAANRLGKAFAMALARRGHAILLHYHVSESQASATAAEIKVLDVPVFLVKADLSDPRGLRALFSEVDRIAHPLKVLVNSAAVMTPGDPRSISIEEWDAVLNLNLRAPFFCAQQAANRMSSGGLIVNVSDVGAIKSWSRYPAYTVSKAALESLTKILARALAPSIRVNAIAPGLVLQSSLVDAGQWQKLVDRLPLKRAARIEEIVAALDFLLANEYVTGQTLMVDGGYSLLG